MVWIEIIATTEKIHVRYSGVAENTLTWSVDPVPIVTISTPIPPATAVGTQAQTRMAGSRSNGEDRNFRDAATPSGLGIDRQCRAVVIDPSAASASRQGDLPLPPSSAQAG